MLRMAQIQYIKDLFENEDLSLREISRRTNHSFNTVKKYAYQENWGEGELPKLEPESYPVLGEFIPIIDEWLETDRKVPRKQRHTMWRMYWRLRDEHGFATIAPGTHLPPPSCGRCRFIMPPLAPNFPAAVLSC